MAAADAQRIGRHQALDVIVFGRRAALAPRLVGLQRAHQPGHAVLDREAEVAGALRHAGAEGDDAARDDLGARLARRHGSAPARIAIDRGSSRLSTIVARVPKMRALAAP